MKHKTEIKTENEIEEERKPSLVSQIQDLNEKLELIAGKQKKKGKEFKLPSGVMSKLKKLHKSKKIAVQKLYEGKGSDFEFGRVEDNMINVEGKWRRCEPKHIWNLNGKYPFIILPMWSNEPISLDHYMKDVENKTTIDSQNFIIRAMEKEEAEFKKGFGSLGMKGIIIIIVLLGVGAWVMFGGQPVP